MNDIQEFNKIIKNIYLTLNCYIPHINVHYEDPNIKFITELSVLTKGSVQTNGIKEFYKTYCELNHHGGVFSAQDEYKTSNFCFYITRLESPFLTFSRFLILVHISQHFSQSLVSQSSQPVAKNGD